MKPIVPSTRGLLSITLYRSGAQRVLSSSSAPAARFGSIRERINALLREWDTEVNPVTKVYIEFTTTGNRSRHG